MLWRHVHDARGGLDGQRTLAPLGLMGMMGEGQMDAKTRGRMLQLRGEMLKAMGEVMMKHGQAMSGEQ